MSLIMNRSPLIEDSAAEQSELILAIREQVMRNPDYIEGVRLGRADADAGRTITLDALFRELGDSW